jgi:hypothetical protein
MRISHGPRGQHGVSSIMGLGDDVEIVVPAIVQLEEHNARLALLERMTKHGARAGAAAWLVLRLVGARKAARVAGIASLTLFGVRELAKRYHEA